MLDLALSPTAMANSCALFVSELCEATYGVSPAFKIETSSLTAGEEAKLGGIGVHLEYILTEVSSDNMTFDFSRSL